MARERKYIHLTDTDIVSVIDKFNKMKDIILSTEQSLYINEQYVSDMENKEYDPIELTEFLDKIVFFLNKKKNRLRIKTDLKLSKIKLIASIFKDMDISPNIRFQVAILTDFTFTKYDIYQSIDEMEDNYRDMYTDYLLEYDRNKMN